MLTIGDYYYNLFRLEFYEKRKHFIAVIICHKEVIQWMTLWNAFKDEFENEKNMLGSSLGRSSTRLMLGEKNMLVVVKNI
ncbi:unnamed protein product [Camellia sinensis]